VSTASITRGLAFLLGSQGKLDWIRGIEAQGGQSVFKQLFRVPNSG